jgi:carbonic anhydrase
MDFRFRTAIRRLLVNLGLRDDYDMVSCAGATMDLTNGDDGARQFILKQIRISIEKHGIQKVYIVHHLDCGAYGGHTAFASLEAEKLRHIEDMKKARDVIMSTFPELTVILMLASRSGEVAIEEV